MKSGPEQVCISAVTRGKVLFGLKLKGGAHRLTQVVEQFLSRVRCLPWDEAATTQFVTVVADLHHSGGQVSNTNPQLKL